MRMALPPERGEGSKAIEREDDHENTTRRKHETKHEGHRKGHGLRGSRFHPPVPDFRDSRFVVLSLFRVLVIF
jgi:hypothetical protein